MTTTDRRIVWLLIAYTLMLALLPLVLNEQAFQWTFSEVGPFEQLSIAGWLGTAVIVLLRIRPLRARAWIAPAWRAWCQHRAALLGNIEWQGPSRDMRAVFARSRVLLMPSVWEESFGRTALEAQLNGLPVLASDRGTAHWLLAVYMMLGGLGMGFVMPTLTIFTQHAAGRAHLGIATALLQSLRMIGGMVGTAVVGTVVSHMYASRTAATLGGKVDAASLEQLSDPRVLVDAETQGRLLTQWAGQGVDGTAMLDTARQALVTAIHGGQVIALVVALAALWCVYRAPRVHLALPGHSQSPKSAGE